MERFPTITALAAARPADVLRAWQGLGYDRRALALRRAACLIVERHGGRVPSSVVELEALPGVGPYTARAVAALAFGRRVGAVDVNVRRVLGRIVAGGGAELLSGAAVQAIADAAVPSDRPGGWTHAVMDVGAALCRPRTPRCGACPARPWCRYAAEVLESRSDRALPVPDRARPTTRRARATAAGPSPARATAAAGPSPARATAAAGPSPAAARPSPARPASARPAAFATTNRWLRGRILDRLRAAPDEAWVELDGPIGVHDLARVHAAAHVMSTDGLLELDLTAGFRARLPLA